MTEHQTLTAGRHARILDNAAGYQGGIGRIIETVDGKVAVLIGVDVVWTEATKVEPGRFVDGQFTADADVETITMSDPPPRDVSDQGPARDVVVEAAVEDPQLCQVPAVVTSSEFGPATIEQLLEQRDAALAAVARVRKAARHPYKGPNDTDASMLRQAVDRIHAGYAPGGSNTTETVTRVLLEVAVLLEAGA